MLAELEADRARVAELQTCILDLERRLSDLRLEKSQAEERLDSYKYPVMTLPSELVSEIFVCVLPPYPDFPQLSGPSSPTVLAQICAGWREIALGTPQLWSALSSFDNGSNQQGWELHIFELWLERSRHCPLSIRLGTDATWASNQLTDAFLPYRTRWEYLKIDLETMDLPIFGGPMPLLRHLDLLVEADLSASVAANEVPRLRSVVLNDVTVLRVILPWTQLTSVTLLRVYPSECVPVLVQTLNLVHCRLDFCSGDTNPELRPDITLPSLESLVLRKHNTSLLPVTDFLPSFIVPALRSLETPEDCLEPNPLASLTAFISRSECRLEQLHVTGMLSVPETSYSQAFPSLRKLSFSEEIDSDDGAEVEDSASSDD
ncbi:hypothetical protein DFH06DRAFT_1481760 [Mycena polygramma]|nr:hypothetical protein DFH06DRAFT_1481760 [Mycena polygramma]